MALALIRQSNEFDLHSNKESIYMVWMLLLKVLDRHHTIARTKCKQVHARTTTHFTVEVNQQHRTIGIITTAGILSHLKRMRCIVLAEFCYQTNWLSVFAVVSVSYFDRLTPLTNCKFWDQWIWWIRDSFDSAYIFYIFTTNIHYFISLSRYRS